MARHHAGRSRAVIFARRFVCRHRRPEGCSDKKPDGDATAASLPLFSQLLFGSNPTEQTEAAIAISAFVNGCNIQTPATVASLGHMYCDNSTPYKSTDTMAHRIFGLGSQAEQASAIAYWQSWWTSHPEVR